MKFFSILTKKESRDRLVNLFELSFLVAVMVSFVFFDPFNINRRIVDYLRLKYPIFIKEPKLLLYSSIYIGSIIAKFIAITAILIFIAIKQVNIDDILGIRSPKSALWKKAVLPFIIFSVIVRFYYLRNPLIPNIPIRLVFPEAMVIGNAIIIFSVLLIAPIIEELIFRGYMYDVFRKNAGPYPAIFLVSLIFAAAHAPQLNYEILDVGIIFLMGLALGILRYRTDSTVVAMLFHGIYNLIFLLVGVTNYMLFGY